jgi:ElaA protein
VRFSQKSFAELTTPELHEILALRVAVFVVEQACAYPELDGRDPESIHLLGIVDGRLAAYARWYPTAGATILGRIVVEPELRGRGLGRRVTGEALRRIGPGEVRVSAQLYLEPFYRGLGFETVSSPYDDYGVAHVDMVRRAVESATRTR